MSGIETSTESNNRVKHSKIKKIIWLAAVAYISFCFFFFAFVTIQSFGFLAKSKLWLIGKVGENNIVFSALENTTVYYGVCDMSVKLTRQKECLLRRVQADFTGDIPKEDECQITLSSESGGFIQTHRIKIEPLGKNRAILRWFESDGGDDDPYHLRFSIVDFSNCIVKTTKLSEDLNQLIKNINDHSGVRKSMQPGQRSCFENGDEKFNKLKYLKGEDDFEVVLEDWDKVYRSSIDSQGVASKVDTLLTYPEDDLVEPLIVPLSKDEGYLFIETPTSFKREKPSITVAFIQSNGQRQNLTHVKDVYSPVVSLAYGLIGICARQNNVTMKCTQFELGDERITWFSVNLLENYCEENRAIYNLPRGEGFLTYGVYDFVKIFNKTNKYLVKFGTDEYDTYLHLKTECEPEEVGSKNIFEDDKGHYCMSTTCMKRHDDYFSSYVKLHSKCYNQSIIPTFLSPAVLIMAMLIIVMALLIVLCLSPYDWQSKKYATVNSS